jgi:hypothetical protein
MADKNHPWLSNILELPNSLKPGDSIFNRDGTPSTVYEVRRLKSKSTRIAGKRRSLFAVLHAGAGSILVAVCIEGRQKEWKV